MRNFLLGLVASIFGLTIFANSCLAQQVEVQPDKTPEPIAVKEDRVLFPKTATWPIYFVWLKQSVSSSRARHAVEVAANIWNRAVQKTVFSLEDAKGGRPSIAFVFTYESEVLKIKDPGQDPSKVIGVATLGCPTADCHLMLFVGLQDLDMIRCAVHELGHLLGLNHSQNKQDIMFPSLTDNWQPSPNDIKRAIAAVRLNP